MNKKYVSDLKTYSITKERIFCSSYWQDLLFSKAHQDSHTHTHTHTVSKIERYSAHYQN
jgi:hypothetical protein